MDPGASSRQNIHWNRLQVQARRFFNKIPFQENQKTFILTLLIGVVCGLAAVCFHLLLEFFQDNIIFNTTVEENIAFEKKIPDREMEKIIYTAALDNFVKERKEGLHSTISERGASLSGGQRQRLSLARALSLHPRLLLLDDFTARVDLKTEQTIVDRMQENYPDTAIFAVTQKIASVKDYDHLILLMEGELLAEGTHKELLHKSFEYQQIYSSQKTTND